jgi:hypothetical protein
VWAQSLVIHIQDISYLGFGILHFRDCLDRSKFTLAIFARVILFIFIFTEFDYVFRVAIFTNLSLSSFEELIFTG